MGKELPPAKFNVGDIVFVESPPEEMEFYGTVTNVYDTFLGDLEFSEAVHDPDDNAFWADFKDMYGGDCPRAYDVEFVYGPEIRQRTVGEDWMSLVEAYSSVRVSKGAAAELAIRLLDDPAVSTSDSYVNEDGVVVVEAIMYRGEEINRFRRTRG